LAAPLDIPRMRIIIQTKGKAQKDGFALRNYQLILFQFFEFTQTLKRSPIIVLFIVYSSVKSNIILQDTDFLSLLMNHKGKFIFYFFVSFIEEVIFRGIIFGLLLQKCKNKYLSCVIAALIFTLPHIFNTDNISVLVMFIFPFLYGIFANEMFYTTKSIWMPTGFHWLWNYTITSLFLVTGTQSFIYVHIIAAMIIMIPLFYIVIGKTRLSGD